MTTALLLAIITAVAASLAHNVIGRVSIVCRAMEDHGEHW